MKTDIFQSCGHCWVFEICWYWVQHFNSITFRIWNSLTGMPSPPLALFIVMLSKAHLTSHSRMSGSRWVSHHCDYLGQKWKSFFCTSETNTTLWMNHAVVLVTQLVVSDSFQPHGPTRLLCPWNSQARILEWVAIPFSRRSSQPRNQTCIYSTGRWILYHWATRETLIYAHFCLHFYLKDTKIR